MVRISLAVSVIALLLFYMAWPLEYHGAKQASTLTSKENLMLTGIMGMCGKYPHVNRELALRVIKETIEVTSNKQFNWLESHDLLGMAINETDLRWWSVTGSRGLWDCGITQNHTPIFAKSFNDRKQLCNRLVKDTKLSFVLAARELTMNKDRWCSKRFIKPLRIAGESTDIYNKKISNWKLNIYKCSFNMYLQGPNYLRGPCEKRISKKNRSKKEYNRRVQICYRNNLYWLRSMCFSVGVRLGKVPKLDCRLARSLTWIKQVYEIK